MSNAKRAKAPKKVKRVKPCKEAVKRPLTKEEKRLVKLTRKDLLQRGKLINRRVSKSVGFLAVFLCIVSSVLDVFIEEKNHKR